MANDRLYLVDQAFEEYLCVAKDFSQRVVLLNIDLIIDFLESRIGRFNDLIIGRENDDSFYEKHIKNGFNYNEIEKYKTANDLLKENEELKSKLKELTEWRPIETAPRDTKVIIYNHKWDILPIATYEFLNDEECWMWVFSDSYLCLGIQSGVLGYEEDIEDGNMPTHWMPLPEALEKNT